MNKLIQKYNCFGHIWTGKFTCGIGDDIKKLFFFLSKPYAQRES